MDCWRNPLHRPERFLQWQARTSPSSAGLPPLLYRQLLKPRKARCPAYRRAPRLCVAISDATVVAGGGAEKRREAFATERVGGRAAVRSPGGPERTLRRRLRGQHGPLAALDSRHSRRLDTPDPRNNSMEQSGRRPDIASSPSAILLLNAPSQARSAPRVMAAKATWLLCPPPRLNPLPKA
jgi:hypothetical protein